MQFFFFFSKCYRFLSRVSRIASLRKKSVDDTFHALSQVLGKPVDVYVSCVGAQRGGSRSMPRNRGTLESRAHQQTSACSAVPIHSEHQALSISSIMLAIIQGVYNPLLLDIFSAKKYIAYLRLGNFWHFQNMLLLLILKCARICMTG